MTLRQPTKRRTSSSTRGASSLTEWKEEPGARGALAFGEAVAVKP